MICAQKIWSKFLFYSLISILALATQCIMQHAHGMDKIAQATRDAVIAEAIHLTTPPAGAAAKGFALPAGTFSPAWWEALVTDPGTGNLSSNHPFITSKLRGRTAPIDIAEFQVLLNVYNQDCDLFSGFFWKKIGSLIGWSVTGALAASFSMGLSPWYPLALFYYAAFNPVTVRAMMLLPHLYMIKNALIGCKQALQNNQKALAIGHLCLMLFNVLICSKYDQATTIFMNILKVTPGGHIGINLIDIVTNFINQKRSVAVFRLGINDAITPVQWWRGWAAFFGGRRV